MRVCVCVIVYLNLTRDFFTALPDGFRESRSITLEGDIWACLPL